MDPYHFDLDPDPGKMDPDLVPEENSNFFSSFFSIKHIILKTFFFRYLFAYFS